MPPKSSKAAAKTSPVLIVFLVIFVLTSIILGVTTYLGFSGQDQLLKDAQAKADEAKKVHDDADWFEFLAITFKGYAGIPLTKKDQEDVGALRRGFEGGTLSSKSRDPNKEDAVKIIRDELDKNMGWDANGNRAVKSFKGEHEALKKEHATLMGKQAETEKDLKEARDKQDTAEKELVKARADYLVALNKANADARQMVDVERGKVVALNKEKEDLGKRLEDNRAEMAQMKGDFEKRVAKLTKDKAGLELNVQKLALKTETINVLDYDRPKGHVKQIDSSGRFPYIDIGSADNLKPGITFSVYGIGPDGKPIAHDVIDANGKVAIGADGKPEKEGKATMEVINILGEHVAQAKVTWVRDPGADPLLRGDLLFNPGWDPKAQQHVAVTGLIDLTGDGKDNMQEFVRNLQRQGVVVDAYLDLKDISVKGRGIDRQTDYLILGINPTFQGAEIVKDDDPRAKRQQAILKEMADMQEKAKENGVTVIPLRKFMVMSGYHVPPGVGVEMGGSSAHPAALSGGGKEKPAGDK
jgi:hypothetical protein